MCIFFHIPVKLEIAECDLLPEVSPMRFRNRAYVSLLRIITISLIIILTVWGTFRSPEMIRILKQIAATPSVLFTKPVYRVRLDFQYRECDHHRFTEASFASLNQLKTRLQKYGHYQLQKQSDRHYICRIGTEGFCASCRDYQFLGISGSNVAVFRGTPRKPGPVKEITVLKAEQLPATERQDLSKGITFRDDKEKLQLLEGLNGLISA